MGINRKLKKAKKPTVQEYTAYSLYCQYAMGIIDNEDSKEWFQLLEMSTLSRARAMQINPNIKAFESAIEAKDMSKYIEAVHSLTKEDQYNIQLSMISDLKKFRGYINTHMNNYENNNGLDFLDMASDYVITTRA